MVAATLSGIFLMLILLQARNTIAQPHYSAEEPTTDKEIVIQPARSSLTMLNELKNTRTGGRKMMVKTDFKKEEKEREDSLNAEDAQISGKNIHASSKKQSGKSQLLTQQQNERNKAASAADQTGGNRQDCFQHSTPNSTGCTTSKPKTSLHYQPKLTHAPDEILNLMNMDYRVPRKPRRKPPINNYAPFSKP